MIKNQPESNDVLDHVIVEERFSGNEFYCRYGKHWVDKGLKINTARQGDYICAICESVRTRDWVKSSIFKRRKEDSFDSD